MVTIKDIAKRAGVAQGTVSNVLNGKGNVSSEKIKRVMDAAHELGYVPNERAALLRKGPNDSLAVIMPSPRARQYTEFYSGFKHYAQAHGFLVTQHLIDENTPSSSKGSPASLLPRGPFLKIPYIKKELPVPRFCLWSTGLLLMRLLLALIMRKPDGIWRTKLWKTTIPMSAS